MNTPITPSTAVSLLCATLALTAGASAQSTAQVVINELSYNDSGADDAEFIELYNRSSSFVDIGGWTLEHDDDNGSNWTITLPSPTLLPPGGFYVLSENPVPGQFNLAPFPLQNSNEILILRRFGSTVEDTVAYGLANGSITQSSLIEGAGLGGDVSLNQTLNSGSIARHLDGQDTDDNGCDFRLSIPTPGAPNGSVHSVTLPYFQNFSSPVPASDWASSFVTPTPTAPGSTPASSDGGNFGSLLDPTGGGNTHHLNAAPETNVRIRTLVFLTTSSITVGGQSWSIGVRGTADTFGDPEDVPLAAGGPSYYAATIPYQSGLTGIAWSFFETPTGSFLYLVDYNNGGGDPIVLETIPIVAGSNDGWRELELTVQGEAVIAEFNNVDYLHRTNHVCSGSSWIAYREIAADNNEIAFNLDGLEVTPLSATADVAFYGEGSNNILGRKPQIRLGNPIQTNTILQVVGQNHAPNNLVVLGIAAAPQVPGLPLAGTPSDFRLHLNANFFIELRFGVSTLDGVAPFFQTIPPLPPSAIGLRTYLQVAEYDVNLFGPGIFLPIAGSEGVVGTL